MVRMTSDEKTSTLLGTNQGPLELRIVGTQLAGQTVRLSSAKCTIGSGNRCTLRLQARRVEPVHCLILRGENGTIVRRWSPHTRLNGANFTDALLQPGDRLTIGPIELDVISTGQTTSADSETSKESVTSQVTQETASAANARLLAELNDRENALKAREAALAEERTTFAAQKTEWEQTQPESQADLASLRDENEALTHELNNLRQLRQDLPDLLEDRQEYDERKNQILADEKELAYSRASFEARRASKEKALAEHEQELDEKSAELDLARQQLDEDRAELETKLQAAEAAFDERDAELNRREAELEAARTESEKENLAQAKDLRQREQFWQNSQAAWAAEREVWNTTCYETSTEFQRQQEELDLQRKQLAAEQEELAKLRAELETAQAAFAAQREALPKADDVADLETQEQTGGKTQKFEPIASEHPATVILFDAEQEEGCDEQAFEPITAEQTSDEETAYPAYSARDLHPRDEALEDAEQAESHPEASDEAVEESPIAAEEDPSIPADEEPSSVAPAEHERELSLAERLLGKHLPEELPDEEESEDDLRGGNEVEDELQDLSETDREDFYSQEPEAPEFEEPAAASPAESSGLIERLRAMTQWGDEEEPSSNQSPASRPGYEPTAPLTPSVPKIDAGSQSDPSRAGFGADEDEESIEDYMAKLMSRVRGESAPAPAAPVPQRSIPQPQPVKVPTPEVPVAEAEQTANAPQEPFELSPRQMPTELTSNLAAMRELANVTARDAIDTSVRNRWFQAAIGKFSVAGMGLLCAVLLFTWSRDPRSHTFQGGGVSLLIAVFWGLQGILVLRNVRRANQVLASKANESAAEAAEMRQMLYDGEISMSAPAEPIQETSITTATEPDAEVVEIENPLQ